MPAELMSLLLVILAIQILIVLSQIGYVTRGVRDVSPEQFLLMAYTRKWITWEDYQEYVG